MAQDFKENSVNNIDRKKYGEGYDRIFNKKMIRRRLILPHFIESAPAGKSCKVGDNKYRVHHWSPKRAGKASAFFQTMLKDYNDNHPGKEIEIHFFDTEQAKKIEKLEALIKEVHRALASGVPAGQVQDILESVK